MWPHNPNCLSRKTLSSPQVQGLWWREAGRLLEHLAYLYVWQSSAPEWWANTAWRTRPRPRHRRSRRDPPPGWRPPRLLENLSGSEKEQGCRAHYKTPAALATLPPGQRSPSFITEESERQARCIRLQQGNRLTCPGPAWSVLPTRPVHDTRQRNANAWGASLGTRERRNSLSSPGRS